MKNSKLLILAAALAISFTAGNVMADSAKLAKRKCGTCHDLSAKAKKKVGPALWGISGRAAGAMEGFRYSKPMKAKAAEGMVWDDANLDAFLTEPGAFLPKTKMKFAGLKKAEERAGVIEYLKTLKSPE